jgi:phage repressor protein C with HTH and peptisase S24 domain
LSPEAFNATDKLKPEVVYAGPISRSTVKDLPVYGAAEGGDGVMVLDNEPIEYMERPLELEGVKGAYAIYVVGESMYPAYEPGDRAYIHPGRPLTPGKDALFESLSEDGVRHATIKRLVRITDKAWKVQQFNPPKTFDLPRAKWQKGSRVVGSYRD